MEAKKRRTIWARCAPWALLLVLFLPGASLANTLSPEDLAKKQVGWYPTGLPLVNYSTDTGLGYGVRLYVFNNGQRSEPHFDSTPYFMRSYAQFFQTTNGQAYHELNVDMPYFMKTRWRLKGEATYKYALNANYFGLGAADADAGLTDVSGRRYDTHEDYQSFLDSGPDDASLLKYNNYQYRKLSTRWLGSRELNEWLEVIAGFEFGRVGIKDWVGERLEDDDFDGISGDTRLTRDRDELTGVDGGWTNMLVLGLKLDFRDFEPNPKTGFLGEYLLEVSGGFLGSDFDYTRQTFSVRGFYTVWSRLTFAARAAMTYSSDETPFFDMAEMTFFSGRDAALGGDRTNRGLVTSRFIAQGITLGQLEVRYFVGDSIILGQRFGLQPTAFMDLGNVYDSFGDIFSEPRFSEYKASFGGGVVIPWNLSTLIRFFIGYSAEGSSVSINFNNAF